MMEEKEKKLQKLFWKINFFLLIPLFFLFVGLLFYLYLQTKDLVNNDMYHPVKSSEQDNTKQKLSEQIKPINILLLGIDANDNQVGRSDAMMIVHLNPIKNEMIIVSIPRDTRTEIVGKGKQDKINHAFAFGATECGTACGASMAIDTVENLLDIKIDYFISMNLTGLVELVNQLGPIQIENDIAWADPFYEFPEGLIQLNGEQTQAYVRMRKQDPSGDFGRTVRQRKVIIGILESGASIRSLPKIMSIMDILGKNVATNMDFAVMKLLLTNFRSTREHIREYMLQGTGKNIDGIYYLIISDAELNKIHNILTFHEKTTD